MTSSSIQIISAILFALAILHTFTTKFFEHLAYTQKKHVGLWRLLGEVEIVFGFWALVLTLIMCVTEGVSATTRYIDSCNFTEPMFVFVIMVIAATRPILQPVMSAICKLAKLISVAGCIGFYFIILTLVPLLGSLITEPAAMTVAALILANHIFASNVSLRLKYATLGVLFVNISIGGTLTTFAAPPILMVAAKWGWDNQFMMLTFGWKAVIAVIINALGVTVWFRKELGALSLITIDSHESIPMTLTLVHMIFLASVIVFVHHPAIFIGLFLFFLGVIQAYSHYQNPLILREGLLVAFFLSGLVVLGGQQQWWLQPLLMNMHSDQIFFATAILSAFTDNAALTYLGSLVDGLSASFKYALVAGAVTGGGLTIIANAPNPAGIAIFRKHFTEETVHPLGLLLAALPPTLIAVIALKYF